VRVLLDENLPLEFAAEIVGHDVVTVRGVGWDGLKNGALMQRAATACDVFVTMDRNIQYQQNIAALLFGVILLQAPSNRIEDLRPIAKSLQRAILDARPGVLQRVLEQPGRSLTP
jgi:hypothetical protein